MSSIRIISDLSEVFPEFPCSWCGEKISLSLYIDHGIGDISALPLPSLQLSFVGISTDRHDIEQLRGKFIAVNSEIKTSEFYLWVCRSGKELAQGREFVTFTCCPECEDYFYLRLMNIITAKLKESGKFP